jgi:acetylornithine deacetylase
MKRKKRLSCGIFLSLALILMPCILKTTIISLRNQSKQMTDTDIQDLFKKIDANSEKHIVFLKELIKAQKFGEEAVQALVAKRFEELGCKTEVLRVLPSSLKMEHEFAAEEVINNIERITVVGTYPGVGQGRSLLMYAHPDPVPITDTNIKGWTHDPFAAEIVGDRIYGYGVADDLEGIAILTEALSALRNAGIQPGGDVYLGSATTKQNARGIIALLTRNYHADGCIYFHPAESGDGLREIHAITSGILSFRITVTGKEPPTTEPGKTVFAHLGVNAIDKAALIKHGLDNLNNQRNERIYYKPIDDKIGRSTNLLINHMSSEGVGIPTKCIIGVSLTFPPFEKLKEIQTEVKNCIAEVTASDPWLREHPPSLVWLYGAEGMELPVEHSIYQTLSNAIQTVTGEGPFVNPLHAASSIFNPYLFSGIPTVGFGPLGGNLTQNGMKDEWVDLPDYIRAIKVAAISIVEWCK